MNTIPWIAAPRRWQLEALEALDHLPQPARPLVRAVMGSGKSVALVELARREAAFGPVVITTPTLHLVTQLAATCRQAGIEPGEWSGRRHQVMAKVTICCDDSLASLAPLAVGACLIVDEAHCSESPAFLDAVKALAPRRVVGFSATPWRASKAEELSLFDVLAFDYSAAGAFADKVCVPPLVESWTGGDVDVDSAVLGWVARVEGPGIVNARSIADAERFAGWLRAAGLRAVAVTSRTSTRELADAFELSRAGGILVHCSLLVAGVDLPWIAWMALRRQYSSSVRAAQEIGRGLRAFPGKVHCRIFDPLDQWSTFALDGLAVLEGGSTAERPPVAIASADMQKLTFRPGDDPALYGIGPGLAVRVNPPRRPAQGVTANVGAVHLVAGSWVAELDRLPPQGEVECKATAWRPLDSARRAVAAAKAVSLSDLEAWLKQEAATLTARGVIEAKCRSRSWRTEPQTERQAAFVGRLVAGVVKHSSELRGDVRRAVGLALMQRGELTRGGASDLTSVMIGVCKGALAAELDAANVIEPEKRASRKG